MSTPNTIRYDSEGSRLVLEAPQALFNEALEGAEHLQGIIELPADERVVDVEAGSGKVRLLADLGCVGLTDNEYIKEYRQKQIVYALDHVGGRAVRQQQDPNLWVMMGIERINNGDRFGMTAKVRWPERDTAEVQALATQAMQQAAGSLQYASTPEISETVYAYLDRQTGATLETSPIGSCSLDTDGSTYDVDRPVIELHGHNLYSRSMQLICLSGLIAIARA